MEITSYIDIHAIIQIAVFMVGITQLLKQFFDVKHRKLKILLTILVGVAGGALLHFLPTWIFTSLLGIAVGVIFYDNVLKILEKLVKGFDQ
jgi:hypothetical protein